MIKIKRLHYEENSDREEPLIYADDLMNYINEELHRYQKWHSETTGLHFDKEIQLLMMIKVKVIEAVSQLNKKDE